MGTKFIISANTDGTTYDVEERTLYRLKFTPGFSWGWGVCLHSKVSLDRMIQITNR